MRTWLFYAARLEVLPSEASARTTRYEHLAQVRDDLNSGPPPGRAEVDDHRSVASTEGRAVQTGSTATVIKTRIGQVTDRWA